MASTYSALKIELIGTGEQSGTWGTTTNTNLGDAALGEAITGSADVAFSSADVTLTLTDTNSTQAARNLRLNLTGTSGGARQLILGSGCQIEKLYLINNGLADAVTVKNTTGTGIAVAAGKSMFVYNNGTNVVDAVTYATSLTLGSALPVASGGTGVTTSTGSGNTVLSTSPTLVTPVLGTPSSGTLTSCTGYTTANLSGSIGLTTQVTGTLPVANGGTGITSLGTGVATFLGTPSSANLIAAVTDETGSGSLVFGTSPTLNNSTITNYVETVVAIGTVTTTNTLALTNGTVQTATLTASTACTFTMPTATAGKSFILLLKQAATTGNGTATFTSVKWNSGGTPTMTATAGKMDIFTFVADGTNWYGSASQGYTP